MILKRENIIKDSMLNINMLSYIAKKPDLYSPGEELFWDDPHISKKMLEAHLDPEWDAASRNHKTIDRTVDWLVQYLELEKGAKILDLGCGPGLYCTRFYKHGLNVTGMDYSKNSINYADDYAVQNNMDIRYIYQNYLTIDYDQEFDAIVLIFCDFGALTDTNRNILLKKIHKALKPGGVFVFDVFTEFNWDRRDTSSWNFSETGFWRPTPHLVLENTFDYQKENVRLSQYTVIDQTGDKTTYKIWDRYYSSETVSGLLKKNDFEVQDIWSDLTGKAYEENTKLLGIAAKKI